MIALATAKLPFCLFSIRQTRLLYSQPPLAAWVPAHIRLLMLAVSQLAGLLGQKSRRPDLNRQPSAYKAEALPN